MDPPPPPLLLTLTLLALAVLARASDFSSNCPAACDCKWSSGNNVADCIEKGLTTIPDGFSNETQTLDFSGNPLYEVTQGAFQMVGLSNLKKLTLKNCSIQPVHKNGLSTLAIVIELDLSMNSIKTLHPDTFSHTEKLKWVYLNNNQLEKIDDGLFKNLQFLKKVDLSQNHIHKIGVQAFVNSPTIKIIALGFNNLTYVNVDTISLLSNLSDLDLHDNPWKCDCHLRPFRDWIIDHVLYTSPTSCAQPHKLLETSWSSLKSTDFACKPSILEPLHNNKMQADGENVTLSCKVFGNPTPNISWVRNSIVIDGDSRRSEDNRHYIQQSSHEMTRWVNLTITHVKYQDRGEYTCVAQSPGGVEERIITLVISRIPDESDIISTVIGIIVSAIALMIIIAFLYFYFYKRGDSKQHIKSDSYNREASTDSTIISGDTEKSLITTINAVTKPPQVHDDTEMSELNKSAPKDCAVEDWMSKSAALEGCNISRQKPQKMVTGPSFASMRSAGRHESKLDAILNGVVSE